MKSLLAIAAAGGLLVVTAQASGGGTRPEVPAPAAAAERLDWGEWTRPAPPRRDAVPPAAPEEAAIEAGGAEIDVVDAHWMALTMWGEARGQGEEAMRAVGHVIANRRAAKKGGAYVTDTVSEAWQFSCWNEGDPNRAAMLAIDDLPRDGEGWRQWLAAKRLAGEILAGRSADPTGGALFYHALSVQPDWSQGMTPSALIGGHLFYLAAS
jgi:N-acetylmuramoyl-L-alanine amidase